MNIDKTSLTFSATTTGAACSSKTATHHKFRLGQATDPIWIDAAFVPATTVRVTER